MPLVFVSVVDRGTVLSRSKEPALPIQALSGIIIANLSHLLAVLVLHQLVLSLSRAQNNSSRLAFVTAALHIISPAGMFLAAPYSESLFAFLNFSGMLCYVNATQASQSRFASFNILLAGVMFGAAATIRGNGLLSGLLLFLDFITITWHCLSTRDIRPSDLKLLLGFVLSGSTLAIGFAIPQIVAYGDYCFGVPLDERRSWCSHFPPSIYSWVQSHYWSVASCSFPSSTAC